MKALILIAGLAAPAVADSKQSATHTMKWIDAQNIHIANQGGAIHHDAQITIEVEVFSSWKAIVSETGKRSANNLYKTYSIEDTTTWSNIWTGTWSLSGDTMKLALSQYKHACEHAKSYSDHPGKTITPCDPVDTQIEMTCALVEVALETKAKVRTWTCTPIGTPKLGETPSRWVLGKASCVQLAGGLVGGVAHYEACPATP